MSKPLLALDVDGVLATYDGWHGPGTPIGLPAPGAHIAINRIRNLGWDALVFTGRPSEQAKEWVRLHRLPIEVWDQPGKPMATAFADDRAYRFEGSFERMLRDLDGLRKPWWARR